MITTLFLLFWAGFIALGYFIISSNLYLIPLWLILGPFVSLLALVVLVVLLMPIMKYTKPTWKPKFYLVRSAAHFISIFFTRTKLTVVGRENIPKTGALTVYANHKSNTDPIGIMQLMTRPLAFTPKIVLYKIPIMSHYMNYIGCLPIDRENNRRTARTLVQAIKNVKDGLTLLIFPEGGIKDRTDEKISSIKAGAFQIGKKAGSNMLPMTIIGGTQYRTRKFFQRVHLKIIVHPVIEFETIKDLSTQEIGEIVMAAINKPFLEK